EWKGTLWQNRLLSVSRPRGARCYGDRASAESKPDHIRALCCIHPQTDGGNATIYRKGRDGPASRRHLRFPAVIAETSRGGEYSAVEAVEGTKRSTRIENGNSQFLCSSLPQRIHNQLEMRGLHMTFTRGAHDVIEDRREFEDFKTIFAKIAIAADVTIAESKK